MPGDRRSTGAAAGTNPKTRGIAFARSLSSRDMVAILQHELLRARSHTPQAEVTLPAELVHEIKSRLAYYAENFGEVERKKESEGE